MKYISNKDDIWQEETLPGVLLEEIKVFKIKKKNKNKEIHIGCAKMQINTVACSFKWFLIICKPKTKEIDFVKTVTTLRLYVLKKKKMQEWRFLGVTFACKWFFRKKLNLEGLQTYERHENHLIMSKNLLIIFLDILLQWIAFQWTSNDWIVWSVAHNS